MSLVLWPGCRLLMYDLGLLTVSVPVASFQVQNRIKSSTYFKVLRTCQAQRKALVNVSPHEYWYMFMHVYTDRRRQKYN